MWQIRYLLFTQSGFKYLKYFLFLSLNFIELPDTHYNVPVFILRLFSNNDSHLLPDKKALTNSAGHDQTAPSGAV